MFPLPTISPQGQEKMGLLTEGLGILKRLNNLNY